VINKPTKGEPLQTAHTDGCTNKNQLWNKDRIQPEFEGGFSREKIVNDFTRVGVERGGGHRKKQNLFEEHDGGCSTNKKSPEKVE